jgi:predicted nucleic acid-binding protein
MRFIDTNVFVRYFEPRVELENRQLFLSARDIFAQARNGAEQFTTNVAVLAEVVFVLSSPRLYKLTRTEISIRLKSILSLPGCAIPVADIVIEALALWERERSISFVDALCVAESFEHQHQLVTFDGALARIAHVERWDLRTIAREIAESKEGEE